MKTRSALDGTYREREMSKPTTCAFYTVILNISIVSIVRNAQSKILA